MRLFFQVFLQNSPFFFGILLLTFYPLGDTFILLGNFIRGAPPLQTPTLNATLIPVLMHPDSDIPRIHICGPEIIPSCADTITLDVAASRGTGGREFIYDVNSVGMLDDEDSEGMGSDTEEPVDRDSDGIPDCADVDSEGTCDDPDWYWKRFFFFFFFFFKFIYLFFTFSLLLFLAILIIGNNIPLLPPFNGVYLLQKRVILIFKQYWQILLVFFFFRTIFGGCCLISRLL